MSIEAKDKIYLVSFIVLLLFLFCVYTSVRDYVDYFFLAEKVKFSFVTESRFFLSLFGYYLFYILLISAIKKLALSVAKVCKLTLLPQEIFI